MKCSEWCRHCDVTVDHSYNTEGGWSASRWSLQVGKLKPRVRWATVVPKKLFFFITYRWGQMEGRLWLSSAFPLTFKIQRQEEDLPDCWKATDLQFDKPQKTLIADTCLYSLQKLLIEYGYLTFWELHWLLYFHALLFGSLIYLEIRLRRVVSKIWNKKT